MLRCPVFESMLREASSRDYSSLIKHLTRRVFEKSDKTRTNRGESNATRLRTSLTVLGDDLTRHDSSEYIRAFRVRLTRVSRSSALVNRKRWYLANNQKLDCRVRLGDWRAGCVSKWREERQDASSLPESSKNSWLAREGRIRARGGGRPIPMEIPFAGVVTRSS